MPTSRHALIIGGGIAGPVMALFLQKAGISSAIYEARSSAEEAGSGLQIAPNGINVLKDIGLDGKVADAGSITTHLSFRNSRGKRLSRIAVGDPKQHGAPAITISRAALHRVLVSEAVQRGIPVYYDRRLVRIADQPGEPVIAHFEDGSSAQGNILIGADGVWSAVRRLAMPRAPQPHYTGLLGVGGFASITETNRLSPEERQTMTMTWGPSGFFGYGECKMPQGKTMMWWSNQPKEFPPTREDLKLTSQTELRNELLAMHGGWHDPIATLIRSTEEVMHIAIYEMPSLPAWHRGRAVLIGDAAHAMATSAGQGASQAIEDTIVLAKLLRDEKGPMENAFPKFEQQRRARVEKISAIARRNSDRKKTLGPFALRVRDFFVAHLLPALAGRSWNAMYAYKIDW